MKQMIIGMCVAGLLAGCGGGSDRVTRSYQAPVLSATGPISKACMRSDRRARNPRLCGCIQSVADRSLSGGDQRMAVKFFKDPAHAQEIRQSDRASHEAFWKRYKAFAARAEGQCRGY